MVERTNVLVFIFTQQPDFRLLLMKRTPSKGGFWQPVSGGIEENEEPLETLTREVFEETGISDLIRIINLDYAFTYRTTREGVMMDMMDICYAVEVEGCLSVTLSAEHLEYRWCTVKETRQYLEWEQEIIALQKLIDICNVKS